MSVTRKSAHFDKNETARGYLVTDLATSGSKAWVYLGGAKGAWDFRAGSGHTYRVAIKTRGGILSPQTWSLRSGLDYDQEQENLRGHAGRGD